MYYPYFAVLANLFRQAALVVSEEGDLQRTKMGCKEWKNIKQSCHMVHEIALIFMTIALGDMEIMGGRGKRGGGLSLNRTTLLYATFESYAMHNTASYGMHCSCFR